MLTDGHLKMIHHLLGELARLVSSMAVAAASADVEAELYRRKHGPFTLAEAIASGRPFRRKGCPIWVKPAPSAEEGPSWLHQRGGGEWLPYLVDTSTGWLEEANEFSSDDITATDYELQEVQP